MIIVISVLLDCPVGFKPYWSVNGCYKWVNRTMEWSVAALHCRSLHRDAHLVVINDESEQSTVTAMLEMAYNDNRQFIFHVLVYCLISDCS